MTAYFSKQRPTSNEQFAILAQAFMPVASMLFPEKDSWVSNVASWMHKLAPNRLGGEK